MDVERLGSETPWADIDVDVDSCICLHPGVGSTGALVGSRVGNLWEENKEKREIDIQGEEIVKGDWKEQSQNVEIQY